VARPKAGGLESEESMKTLWRCKWIGVGLLASVLMMGCRHCRNHCRDEVICWDCTNCAPVKTAEAPKYSVGTVEVTPVTHAEPQVTEVKKVKRNPASIQWTVMAPDGPGVCNPGTMEITADEAEAMGVRPGYTPGALYLIAKTGDDGNIVEHADLKDDKEKGKENSAIPAKGEK
jgi:hypothetical protein